MHTLFIDKHRVYLVRDGNQFLDKMVFFNFNFHDIKNVIFVCVKRGRREIASPQPRNLKYLFSLREKKSKIEWQCNCIPFKHYCDSISYQQWTNRLHVLGEESQFNIVLRLTIIRTFSLTDVVHLSLKSKFVVGVLLQGNICRPLIL